MAFEVKIRRRLLSSSTVVSSCIAIVPLDLFLPSEQVFQMLTQQKACPSRNARGDLASPKLVLEACGSWGYAVCHMV